MKQQKNYHSIYCWGVFRIIPLTVKYDIHLHSDKTDFNFNGINKLYYGLNVHEETSRNLPSYISDCEQSDTV
jgi:hypothetical protein